MVLLLRRRLVGGNVVRRPMIRHLRCWIEWKLQKLYAMFKTLECLERVSANPVQLEKRQGGLILDSEVVKMLW